MPHAPTPCLEPGCYDHVTVKGRCGQHQKEAFAGSTRVERLPKDWPTRRLVVLRRDKGICYLCGEGGADSVDHVNPGDDHSFENLAAAHLNVEPFCHRYKTSAEGNAARRGGRTARRY